MWIYLICGFLFIVAGILLYQNHQYKQHKYEIISRNEAIEQENTQIAQQNEALKKEYSEKQEQVTNIKNLVVAQERILESTRRTTEVLKTQARDAKEEIENIKAQAEEQADIKYQEAIADLRQLWEQEQSRYRSLLLATLDEKAQEEAKVADLQAKQQAYIEEKARQEKIAAEQDYWRLALSKTDEMDVNILRNIQLQLTHKDAIDKVLWSVYFKPAFDILSSHTFTSANKVSGIYRITCLSNGKMYVGQSVDIKTRWTQHIKAGLAFAPASNALYRAMQEYGVQNFTFEILEEVPPLKLNERESYYIDFYKTRDIGLNNTRGGA